MTKHQTEEYKKLPDGTVLSDADIKVLENFNNSYTHTVFGGKNIIIGQRKCQVQGSVFTFEPLREFKNRFLNKPLVGIGKAKNQGDAWLRWSGKNYMPNGTGFYPDPKKCPDGVFNLFRGLQVQPVEGDCDIYLDHLKNVICAGDDTSYTYLIGWLAHLFQQPDIKPNVAIVLKSVEGTGKGTMASPILQILDTITVLTVLDSEKKLAWFKKRYSLTNDVLSYKFESNNKNYIKIIHGSFASKEEALSAIKSLHPRLQKNKPFVEKLSKHQLLAQRINSKNGE